MTIGELQARLMLGSSTLTGAVDRMERAGPAQARCPSRATAAPIACSRSPGRARKAEALLRDAGQDRGRRVPRPHRRRAPHALDAARQGARAASAETTMSDERAGEEFRVTARRGLPPDEVRELSRSRRGAPTLSIAQTVALAAACIAAAVVTRGRPWHPLVVVAAILGVVGAQHALAVLAHEGGALPHLQDALAQRPRRRALRRAARPVDAHLSRHPPHPPQPPLRAARSRSRAHGRLSARPRLPRAQAGQGSRSASRSIKNYYYFVGKPQGVRRIDDTSPALRAAARRERKLVALANHRLLSAVDLYGFLALVSPALVPAAGHDAAGDPAPARRSWSTAPSTTPRRRSRPRAPTSCPSTCTGCSSRTTCIITSSIISIRRYRIIDWRECHRRLRARGVLDGAEVAAIVRR